MMHIMFNDIEIITTVDNTWPKSYPISLTSRYIIATNRLSSPSVFIYTLEHCHTQPQSKVFSKSSSQYLVLQLLTIFWLHACESRHKNKLHLLLIFTCESLKKMLSFFSVFLKPHSNSSSKEINKKQFFSNITEIYCMTQACWQFTTIMLKKENPKTSQVTQM